MSEILLWMSHCETVAVVKSSLQNGMFPPFKNIKFRNTKCGEAMKTKCL